MTKISQAEFEAATIMEVPPVKTREQRLEEWKNQNRAAYQAAQRSCCICTPSRAEALLVEQYEGNGPSDI